MISFMEKELPEIPVTRPEGTYLVWMDFRSLGMCDSDLEDFCRKKAKIAFDPGYEFGMGGSGYMRAQHCLPQKDTGDGTGEPEESDPGARVLTISGKVQSYKRDLSESKRKIYWTD